MPGNLCTSVQFNSHKEKNTSDICRKSSGTGEHGGRVRCRNTNTARFFSDAEPRLKYASACEGESKNYKGLHQKEVETLRGGEEGKK